MTRCLKTQEEVYKRIIEELHGTIEEQQTLNRRLIIEKFHLHLERNKAIRVIKEIQKELKIESSFPRDLHLVDILEKHILKYL